MKQKRWTRQWLSVLMALAILCSLAAPAAAQGTEARYDYYIAPGETITVSLDTQYYQSVEWVSSSNHISVSGNNTIASVTALATATPGEVATVTAYSQYSGFLQQGGIIKQFTICVVSDKGTYSKLSKSSLEMNIRATQYLEVVPQSDNDIITKVTWTSSAEDVVSVIPDRTSATLTALSAGTARVDAIVLMRSGMVDRLSCLVTVSQSVSTTNYGASIFPSTVTLNSTNGYGATVQFSPDPALQNQGYYFGEIEWKNDNNNLVTVTKDPYQPFFAYISGSPTKFGTVTIRAEYTYYYDAEKQRPADTAVAYCTVTVGNRISVEATATMGENLYLSDAYTFDRSSVANQINSAMQQYVDENGSRDSLLYVEFKNVISTAGSLYARQGVQYYNDSFSVQSNQQLSAVYFTPTATGTAEFEFTATGINRTSYAGVLSITVLEKPSPDILYTPARGQSQTLDVKDFNNFWHKTHPNGDLSYVSFGSAISGANVGSLYYSNTAITGSNADLTFSASSIGTGYHISDVSFIPTRSSSGYATGTLVIPFTATGTANTGATPVTQRGYLYITVPSGTVSAIRYSATTTALVSSDFTTVYRSAVGASSANANMYIQFLDLPSSGALYLNYSGTASTRVLLTANNVGSYQFYNTARTTTTNSISDVTYVPGSTSRGVETIRYAAYNTSGDLQYIGTIEFAYMVEASVSYVSGIAGVTFRNVDFFGTGSPLEAGQYIAFGDPSSGKLYRNYVKGSGTAVTATTYFASTNSSGIYAISDVTYVPSNNFAGTVTIPFTVYDANTSVGSGKVTIQVSSKSFVDAVDKTHWAYPFIYRLVAEGVVKGTDDTHFSPKKVVTNGEAIKMILLAVGYDDPGQGSGSAWAQPYIDMAYQKKIISSNEVPSAETISRQTMVMLAAKAMGLSPASSVNAGIDGPTDISGDAAGYIRAMYNAGIINGTVENGVNKFKPTSSLTREEMAKIVCLIMDYCDERG